MYKYILIIFFSLFLIGCKSKKKTTERVHTKKELVEIKKIVDSTKKEVKDVILNKNSSEEIKLTENKDVELTQADSNKQITVIDSQGKKTIYKGANVVIRNTKKKELKKDTSSVDMTKVVKTEIVKTDNSITTTKEETKKRTSDSSVKGISPMIGLGIGLVAVILLIIIYKNRRRILS